jgi:hypothetical protein
MAMQNFISGFGFGGQAKTVDVDFEKFVSLLAGSSVFQAKMAVAPRVERRAVARETAPIGMFAQMA